MIFNHTLSWLIKASWYQSLSSRVSAHLHSRVRNLPRWILCGVDPQLAVVLSSAARRSPLSLVAVVTLLRLHQPVDLRLRLRLRLRLPPQSPSSSAPQLVDLLCRSSRLCRRRLCCVGELFLPTLYIAYKILMMLAVDPSKKISFNRCIGDGDLVIVYERHDNMKAVKVCENSVLQNRFGVFKHSDWIGKPFGSKVLSNKGGFVYLLAPTPELWTLVLSHRTQILYIADISFVIMYLEIVPGCLVLESGTGSGSLTTSLARAVAPTGHVYTFDFHEQRAVSAREDFERTGLSSLVTVGVRDIQGEGFPDDFSGKADSVFLDLPQPWLAIPSAGKMLKQDGILCSFSPCIEQVQRSCETLRANFTDVRTFEVLLRMYEVREGKMENSQADESVPTGSHRCKRRQRSSEGGNGNVISSSPTVMARPSSEARGHTGYLTFARLICLS